jgi:hypothetical protein
MGRRIAAKALIIVALYLNFTGVCASPAPAESGSFNFLWENDAIAGTDPTTRTAWKCGLVKRAILAPAGARAERLDS